MCSSSSLQIFFALLLTHQVSAHVGYLLASPSAQEKAEQFDKTAEGLCTGQPLTCIEPLLHKDFKFVSPTQELDRAQYVEFLKSQTKVKNDFVLDFANAQNIGDQVDVPVLQNDVLQLHLFLVDDASVQGGLALIKIDKKNI